MELKPEDFKSRDNYYNCRLEFLASRAGLRRAILYAEYGSELDKKLKEIEALMDEIEVL